MIHSLHPVEIFLHPGDYYFGDKNTRIRTVLGSCVSITFWHPRLMVGGMCHYMLPERNGVSGWPASDGRYADAAIALLLKEMNTVGVPHKEYQVKLFGGSSMFSTAHKNNIGTQNVLVARQLVKHHGFTCVAEQMGGVGPRNVIFEVWSGDVWVKHHRVSPITEHERLNRSL